MMKAMKVFLQVEFLKKLNNLDFQDLEDKLCQQGKRDSEKLIEQTIEKEAFEIQGDKIDFEE